MSFPTFCAILANFGLVCLFAGGIKSSAARMRLVLASTLCAPEAVINTLAKRVLFWSLLGLFGWACLITALVAFLVHWF